MRYYKLLRGVLVEIGEPDFKMILNASKVLYNDAYIVQGETIKGEPYQIAVAASQMRRTNPDKSD
jgi:hypothetical protein